MATKKKKSSKKKAAKKKKTAKKKTPKKRSIKKKVTKKKTARKAKANAGKMRIELTQGGKVDGGPKSVWSVRLLGLNGDSIPAGLVTAKTKTEAMARAKKIIKQI